MLLPDKNTSPIAYSCYTTSTRQGEQFIPEYVLSYQVSGQMIMNDGSRNIFSTPEICGWGGATA